MTKVNNVYKLECISVMFLIIKFGMGMSILTWISSLVTNISIPLQW